MKTSEKISTLFTILAPAITTIAVAGIMSLVHSFNWAHIIAVAVIVTILQIAAYKIRPALAPDTGLPLTLLAAICVICITADLTREELIIAKIFLAIITITAVMTLLACRTNPKNNQNN